MEIEELKNKINRYIMNESLEVDEDDVFDFIEYLLYGDDYNESHGEVLEKLISILSSFNNKYDIITVDDTNITDDDVFDYLEKMLDVLSPEYILRYLAKMYNINIYDLNDKDEDEISEAFVKKAMSQRIAIRRKQRLARRKSSVKNDLKARAKKAAKCSSNQRVTKVGPRLYKCVAKTAKDKRKSRILKKWHRIYK